MKRALRRPLLIGVAAYLVFVVASAPAAKILPLFAEDVFSGIDGTLWSGGAASVSSGDVQMQNVSWRFHPSRLLLARVEYGIEGKIIGGFLHANAGSGLFSDPYLADVEGRVAAAEVLEWLELHMMQVEGRLDFTFDHIIWTGQEIPQLEGRLTWGGAAVTTPVELLLGSITLGIHSEEDKLVGQLQARDGALQGEGMIIMEQGGAYRLDARLRRTGQVPQAVDRFLETFAEYKDNVYHLEWSDSL